MTVVTTADTSQLYALAARHGLKLHGPLTVNELGLDYRIVIATVDDGRRWVLRIPRRAEVSAKVEPEARVLAMLKNRLPFAVPGYRKYKPPFCSSSEVSYLKFPHSFTAQAPILTAGPA